MLVPINALGNVFAHDWAWATIERVGGVICKIVRQIETLKQGHMSNKGLSSEISDPFGVDKTSNVVTNTESKQ